MTRLSTLCYIERDGKYLMLHRTVKKQDVNKDKWIGVGGHFEEGESPEECLLREVKEETGYTLTSWKYRGIVTFVYGKSVTEYMSLYTADVFCGQPIPCDEGELEWIEKEKIKDLNLWEGDKIFFRLLNEDQPFFSLKLVYNTRDVLQYAALDGKRMELLDLLNPDGTKSGIVRERGVAHTEGGLHGTVHTWIIRKNESGSFDVLLQKRSPQKESNPGRYDISSAGHVASGDGYLCSALRELEEELGIAAKEEDLKFAGIRGGRFEDVFHGKHFVNEELCHIYIYEKPVDTDMLKLQESEVESVRWMEWEELRKRMWEGTIEHCILDEELELLYEEVKRINENKNK